MLEFKSSVLQFKFNGTDCAVKFPTIKALKEFRDKTKGMAEDDVDKTIEFLTGLGLQKDVAESLEVSHLSSIIEALAGESKKK
jgi:hypothetical protein